MITRIDPILENRVSQKDLAYDDTHDGTTISRTDTWHYTSTTIQNPDDGITTHSYFAPGVPSDPKSGNVFKVLQPNGDLIERFREENIPQDVMTGNSFVRAEYRTVADSLGNPSKTSMKVFDYDKNGNLLQTEEYDWFSPPSLIPRGPLGEPNGIASVGGPVRTTVNTYHASTGAFGSSVDFPDAYWDLSSPPLRSAVERTKAYAGTATGTLKSEAVFTYDDPVTTGNVTQETRGLGSEAVTTSMTYTASGNVETTTDPNGNVTRLTYSTVCGVTDLYPMERKDAEGTPVQRRFTFDYDCDTGLKKLEQDEDNNRHHHPRLRRSRASQRSRRGRPAQDHHRV